MGAKHKSYGNLSAPYLVGVRLGLGLTKREAARKVGVSERTLRRYERRGITGNIRYSRVMGLCNAYGISAELLLSLMMQPTE